MGEVFEALGDREESRETSQELIGEFFVDQTESGPSGRLRMDKRDHRIGLARQTSPELLMGRFSRRVPGVEGTVNAVLEADLLDALTAVARPRCEPFITSGEGDGARLPRRRCRMLTGPRLARDRRLQKEEIANHRKKPFLWAQIVEEVTDQLLFFGEHWVVGMALAIH